MLYLLLSQHCYIYYYFSRSVWWSHESTVGAQCTQGSSFFHIKHLGDEKVLTQEFPGMQQQTQGCQKGKFALRGDIRRVLDKQNHGICCDKPALSPQCRTLVCVSESPQTDLGRTIAERLHGWCYASSSLLLERLFSENIVETRHRRFSGVCLEPGQEPGLDERDHSPVGGNQRASRPKSVVMFRESPRGECCLLPSLGGW